MLDPQLSRRLAADLNHKPVALDERTRIAAAASVLDDADGVASWDDLPEDIQTLVEDIEARPDREV